MLTVSGQLIKVSRPDGKPPYRHWPVICDCGNELTVMQGHLISGHTESCGCFKLANLTTHGESRSPTYRSWHQMKQRCYNPNAHFYEYYGGRGIGVCQAWRSAYEPFKEDMGERPPGLTLDRIDSDGDYERSNCRWATHETQQNNRRTNHHVTIQGETKTVAQWAKHFGIVYTELAISRIRWGWDPLTAFTIPPGPVGLHHFT